VTAPTILLAALLGAAVASPAPSPAPGSSSGPLREIGHVRVSAACGNIVVHANSAISSALRNDATLVHTVDRLRNMDLDSSTLSMQQGIRELDTLAGQMHRDAVQGVGEVKRLRELAEKTTDPKRKEELKAFADWLGGALYRQKKVSMDLGGFVAYLQYRDMTNPTESDTNAGRLGSPERAALPSSSPVYHTAAHKATLNEMAVDAAIDFANRIQDIAQDEGRAADHAEGAVSGC